MQQLKDGASRAIQDPSALKDVGKEISNALPALAPPDSKEIIHHVTETHVMTTISVVKATDTVHVIKTDTIQMIQTLTQAIYKEVTIPVTQIVTMPVQNPVPAPVPALHPSLFKLGPNAVCRVNNERRLSCYGHSNGAVVYEHVSNHKFEKCAWSNSAHCFNRSMTGELKVFMDRDDKTRGVVCATWMPPCGVMQCWGTVKDGGGMKYKQLGRDEYEACLRDVGKCM
jgi:hypothetical protein